MFLGSTFDIWPRVPSIVLKEIVLQRDSNTRVLPGGGLTTRESNMTIVGSYLILSYRR